MTIINKITSPKDDLDDELLVRELYYSNNDKITDNDVLIDLETSKTTISLDSQIHGYVEYLVNEGDTVEVGKVVINIHDVPFDEKNKELNDKEATRAYDVSEKIISNDAAVFIRENNIDITKIEKHFITLSDVMPKDKLKKELSSFEGKKNQPNQKTVIPKNTSELILTHAKKNEIKAMTGVQSAGLVSTIFMDVDVSQIFYEYETEIFKDSNSFLPIIIFEVSRLLNNYPILNAYFDQDVIRLYEKINIGIAIDIDDGLKVCKLNSTNEMSMSEIEQNLSKNIDDYMNRDLKVEQLSGSTFTVTDLSSFGVSGVIPLVNYNQCAILGISALDKKLSRITLSLSFDHRVTEGKIVSLFLSDLKKRLVAHSSSKRENDYKIELNLKCNYCMKTLEEDNALNGNGFLKIINHSGEEKYICKTCLDGWK